MQHKDVMPAYYDILSAEDQFGYNKLRQSVGSEDNRYNRNRRLVKFSDMLNEIRTYCEEMQVDTWKRYLVCGICWFSGCLAINTRQLTLLLAKSKSSINGALAKMGYTTRSGECNELLNAIPYLRGNSRELRQWTVRQRLTNVLSPLEGPCEQSWTPCEPVVVPRPVTPVANLDCQDIYFPEEWEFEPQENNWQQDYPACEPFEEDWSKMQDADEFGFLDSRCAM